MSSLRSWTFVAVGSLASLFALFAIILVRPIRTPSSRLFKIERGTGVDSRNMSYITERPKWILFGDSLTERSLGFGGWGSSMAHAYYRKIDVVNRGQCMALALAVDLACMAPCGGPGQLQRSCSYLPVPMQSAHRFMPCIFLGFGGYSSRWALHLIRDIFKGCDESNTGLVTLFWGANDAARPLPEGNE